MATLEPTYNSNCCPPNWWCYNGTVFSHPSGLPPTNYTNGPFSTQARAEVACGGGGGSSAARWRGVCNVDDPTALLLPPSVTFNFLDKTGYLATIFPMSSVVVDIDPAPSIGTGTWTTVFLDANGQEWQVGIGFLCQSDHIDVSAGIGTFIPTLDHYACGSPSFHWTCTTPWSSVSIIEGATKPITLPMAADTWIVEEIDEVSIDVRFFLETCLGAGNMKLVLTR